MLPAIILFAVTYVLMITFGKYRPYIALASGLVFIVTGISIQILAGSRRHSSRSPEHNFRG